MWKWISTRRAAAENNTTTFSTTSPGTHVWKTWLCVLNPAHTRQSLSLNPNAAPTQAFSSRLSSSRPFMHEARPLQGAPDAVTGAQTSRPLHQQSHPSAGTVLSNNLIHTPPEQNRHISSTPLQKHRSRNTRTFQKNFRLHDLQNVMESFLALEK